MSYSPITVVEFRPLRELYRAARAATHPDRTGGDRAMWDQVEAAARVLGVSA